MATGGCDSVKRSREILRQLSHQSSDGYSSRSTVVCEELELLKNVYFEQLDLSEEDGGEVQLKFHVTPSTADDKDRQYVYLDLEITLTDTYPNGSPQIKFLQSRGLSDAHLRHIAEGLRHKSVEYLGSPMVYELVEFAKDCLTDNNRPCGQCAVCQFDFDEADEFTRTNCYHYFHLPCLVSYIEFFVRQQKEREEEGATVDKLLRKKPKQLECPVCREPIPQDATCLEAIRGISPPVDTEELKAFTPTREMRRWQVEMAALLRRQRETGGVIDPNPSNDVIDETWVSRRSEPPVESLSSDNRAKVTVKTKKDQSKPRHPRQTGYGRGQRDQSRQTGNIVMGDRGLRGQKRGQKDEVKTLISGTDLEMTDGHCPTVTDEESQRASSRGPPPGFSPLPVASPQASSSQPSSENQGGGGTRREGGRRDGGHRRERWQQGSGGRSHSGQPRQEEGHRYRPRRPPKEYCTEDMKKPPAVDKSAESESRHSTVERSQTSRPQATNRCQHQRQRVRADGGDLQPRDRDRGRRKEGGGRESSRQGRSNRHRSSSTQNSGLANFSTESTCPQTSSDPRAH